MGIENSLMARWWRKLQGEHKRLRQEAHEAELRLPNDYSSELSRVIQEQETELMRQLQESHSRNSLAREQYVKDAERTRRELEALMQQQPSVPPTARGIAVQELAEAQELADQQRRLNELIRVQVDAQLSQVRGDRDDHRRLLRSILALMPGVETFGGIVDYIFQLKSRVDTADAKVSTANRRSAELEIIVEGARTACTCGAIEHEIDGVERLFKRLKSEPDITQDTINLVTQDPFARIGSPPGPTGTPGVSGYRGHTAYIGPGLMPPPRSKYNPLSEAISNILGPSNKSNGSY